MPQRPGTLIFFCGKMAAGKSTLARELAARDHTVRLEQDHFIATLFPGEVVDIPSYVTYSRRLRQALTPHILSLLATGIDVVLDFPGNTRLQRAWFRELFESANAAHELHYIVASDERCKRQLRERSRQLPPGTPWTTEAEFDTIMAHFDPPGSDEAFNVVRHQR
ncbi:MAG TPA: ATP-binding protein [Vicinamibacterales bacterium]|nr:ATP-binding protein [Vicinamibacterales bacterium]